MSGNSSGQAAAPQTQEAIIESQLFRLHVLEGELNAAHAAIGQQNKRIDELTSYAQRIAAWAAAVKHFAPKSPAEQLC